jgi:Arc/MetJ-type ribon-helix-helix transcriptional regulator
MATKKVTVTLEQAQLAAIQELVGSGKAASVSGFVQHAVSIALDDVAGWADALNLALHETGGRLTPRERKWADSVLKGRSPRSKAKASKGKAA